MWGWWWLCVVLPPCVEKFVGTKEWIGLTDEEILTKCESVPDYDIGNHDLIRFARAIEAKLKKKNAL